MKLKGKNVEKIPSSKKKKMEKTLKKMEETRVKDSINMRVLVNGKLEHLNEEDKKLISLIKIYEDKLIEFKNLKLKIEGAIISLKEILQDDSNV